MKQIDLPNSEIINRINEHIHSKRDREILRLRFVDGYTYDELSAEFYLSRRQIARIIAKANTLLKTEHPPDTRRRKGTLAALRGCFFYAMIDLERRCERCTIMQEIRYIIR